MHERETRESGRKRDKEIKRRDTRGVMRDEIRMKYSPFSFLSFLALFLSLHLRPSHIFTYRSISLSVSLRLPSCCRLQINPVLFSSLLFLISLFKRNLQLFSFFGHFACWRSYSFRNSSFFLLVSFSLALLRPLSVLFSARAQTPTHNSLSLYIPVSLSVTR